MIVRGGKLDLHEHVPTDGTGGGKEEGAVITTFSRASRKHLQDIMLGVDWQAVKAGRSLWWAAVTYPAEYPKDGKKCKADFDRLMRNLERHWGPVAVIWKREFQRRGAPHYHLVMALPERVAVDEARGLLKWTWATIAGQETAEERQAATQCEAVRNIQTLSTYCANYLGKDDQNDVPEGFEHPGRFWGVRRPELLPSCLKAYLISDKQFYAGEKMIRDRWEAKGLPNYSCYARITLLDFDAGAVDAIAKKILDSGNVASVDFGELSQACAGPSPP